MPIIPRNNEYDPTIVTSSGATTALYVDGRDMDYGVQVEGKLRIVGMQEDVQTAIKTLQARLDKLERFYAQMTSEAQAVVDASEYAQNTDEWKERVFRIAEEVGLRETAQEGKQDGEGK